jgi:hypothetical protein
LGIAEQLCLLGCGLENFHVENAPIWYWYSKFQDLDRDALLISAFFAPSNDEKAGAIGAMRLLGVELPSEPPMDRVAAREKWLSKETPNNVKLAALAYYSEYGQRSDLPALREAVASGDYQTSRLATEALLQTELRYSRGNAAKIAISTQFETIDSDLVSKIFVDATGIDIATLRQGLDHRSAQIRFEPARLLRSKRALSADVAERLITDSSPKVRFEALRSLTDKGQLFSEAEAEKVLVKPKMRALGLLSYLGTAGSDPEGQKYFDEYQRLHRMGLSEAQLVGPEQPTTD